MKTNKVATGILGALAMAGALGLGACSAETGSGDPGAIGSTSEALSADSLIFSGFLKLDANKILSLGGYNSSGTGQTTSKIYDANAGTWTALSNALPTGLGEVEIAPIPGQTDKYLVSGGRASRDGAATNVAYVLTLNISGTITNSSWHTVSGSGGHSATMSANRAGYALQKCGDSNLIAIGGLTTKGMDDLANTVATKTIDRFTFVATNNGEDSYFEPLSDGTHTVNLQTDRGYGQTLHISDTKFVVVGGRNASATALGSTEILTVNSSCVASNASHDVNGYFLPFGNPLPDNGDDPDTRSAFAAIKTSDATYPWVIAAGRDAGNGYPVAAYRFKTDDTWNAAGSISAGREFAQLVFDASHTATLIGGVVRGGTPTVEFYTTSDVKDPYTDNTNTWGTVAHLTNARVGFFSGYVNSAVHVGMGGKYTTGTLAMQADIE